MHRLLFFPLTLLLLAACDQSATAAATKPAPPAAVTTTQPRPGDVIRSITQSGNVRITARHADPGAFISAANGSSTAQNAAIYQLADFRHVRVELDVPEIEVPSPQNESRQPRP